MLDYATALKKVQSKKQRENFMVIRLAYNVKVVLPFKEGNAFIASLNNAEIISENYGEKKRITEFGRDTITMEVMSASEYERFKIAALLDITPEEVKEHELTTV